MLVIRSTFWLVAAYFFLVPQLQIARTIEDLSGQALGAGQQIATDQLNNTNCQSVECMGAKLVLSAGLDAFIQDEQSISQSTSIFQPEHGAMDVVIPMPQPRLSRPG